MLHFTCLQLNPQGKSFTQSAEAGVQSPLEGEHAGLATGEEGNQDWVAVEATKICAKKGKLDKRRVSYLWHTLATSASISS